MTARALLALSSLLLAGCAMGPDYRRPQVPVPPEFRNAPPGVSAASLAETKWSDLFRDEKLNRLISAALEHNFDLAIAAERVEEARARFHISAAAEYPSLSAQSEFDAVRPSRNGANTYVPSNLSLDASYTQSGAALSWELDLWGRLRRMTEAARAQYLATEEGRRGVIVSLVADVAKGYFTLRERDLELEIAQATRDVAEQNLKLIGVRHDHGAATGLDLHQAEQFLYTATAQIARSQGDIGQAEDALSLLVGEVPGDVVRGRAVDDFGLPPEVPPGLPSELLERRPDIRQAEQALVAANAQIGVARASFFPQLSLTGFLGGQSRSLLDLFTGPARFWSIAPANTVPIFEAGQLRAGLRFSEAQKREMLITYRKTIYTAFREVSDALVRYDRTREQRKQQDTLVRAAAETVRLSTLRYQGGLDSYLQVLVADRSLFESRLTLAQLRLDELLSFIDIYRALGGGWQ